MIFQDNSRGRPLWFAASAHGLLGPCATQQQALHQLAMERLDMLVLTRRPGQSIILTLPNGSEIRLLLKKCSKSQAQIGIQCADNVNIRRDEIPLEKQP